MTAPARSGFLKGMNPRVTLASLALVLTAAMAGALYTGPLEAGLAGIRAFVNPFLEWYYVVLVSFLLFFMIWLGVGRYKNVRLGGENEQPEFTLFSWISMLFAAGTGVGILFWSVAQPLMQFRGNPFVEEGLTPDAARVAMRLTYFHWGLNGWAIFAFVALVLGFFAYRRDMKLTIRSGLQPLLGRRTYGVLGDTVDTLAAFATVFGIATTLGLGVQQMNAGLGSAFGIEASTAVQLIVIAVIMTFATLSVISGVSRGVRLLSVANYWLSAAMLLAVLLLGPTQYLFALTIEATGDYIQNLLFMNLYTNATHNNDWQSQWTVFFWGWWIAWAPFVGMFIARISRGRTFREFVMGVLLVPTLITVFWIGLFGGTALHQELFGNGGNLDAVAQDPAKAVFLMIADLQPGTVGQVLSGALVALVGMYLITSANAGTLVVNTLLSGGDPEPPTLHRIIWGIVLALLTGVLLVAGGLQTLQSAVVMAALPFSIIIILMVVGLVRSLREERYASRSGERSETPREPYADLEDAGSEPTQASPDDIHKDRS